MAGGGECPFGRPSASSSQNSTPKTTCVRAPDRESGEQEFAAAEIVGVRGDQTGHQNRYRDDSSEHEERERDQCGRPQRPAATSTGEQQINRQQQGGSGNEEPDPPVHPQQPPVLLLALEGQQDEQEKSERRRRGRLLASLRSSVSFTRTSPSGYSRTDATAPVRGIAKTGAGRSRAEGVEDFGATPTSRGYLRCQLIFASVVERKGDPSDGAQTEDQGDRNGAERRRLARARRPSSSDQLSQRMGAGTRDGGGRRGRGRARGSRPASQYGRALAAWWPRLPCSPARPSRARSGAGASSTRWRS